MRSMLATGVKLLAGACLAAVSLLVGGFIWFASEIANAEPDRVPDADGVVALTGGVHRLGDAARLLAEGRAKRLLVTGVHSATPRADVVRQLDIPARWTSCCVDLDYEALNTIGNAEETRKWARKHGFRSLIVVTSAYHMPRSLAELRHRMPDVTLVPYPVANRRGAFENWWESPATMQTLALEYAKYLVGVARRTLAPEPSVVLSRTTDRPVSLVAPTVR
jgi:uncharacterized SAM-binding protein YcdF (DUF218 family)